MAERRRRSGESLARASVGEAGLEAIGLSTIGPDNADFVWDARGNRWLPCYGGGHQRSRRGSEGDRSLGLPPGMAGSGCPRWSLSSRQKVLFCSCLFWPTGK